MWVLGGITVVVEKFSSSCGTNALFLLVTSYLIFWIPDIFLSSSQVRIIFAGILYI